MADKNITALPAYSESSIRVLKGLEPVKQRPGMYTRTDNPLHIIQEVLDNSADEALAGHGKKIKVTLHIDGSVTIEDDGRGIPFGLHPEEQAPVVELVFTRLHAGGKFDKGKGGAYSFSGGLHGVGVSVTNALSTRLEVTSYREGKAASLAFSGGDVIEPLVVRPVSNGNGDRKSGTTVRAWPDAKYFESSALPMAELTHLLRSKAVLMPGVSVTLTNEKTKDVQTWLYKGGLRDYLMQTLNAEPVIPMFEKEGFADKQKACIAGASYGGYATLMGLVRHPELYRCGVAWVAVTDPLLYLKGSWWIDDDISGQGRRYQLPQLVGDAEKDLAMLTANSPLAQASRIKAPLLLAFGESDLRVPLAHGKRLREAMADAGNPPEWVSYQNEGHSWRLTATQVDWARRVERFLATHLKRETP